MMAILERIRRAAGESGSVLRECGWSACVGADEFTLSGRCGAAGVEISSVGAVSLGLEADGHGASVTISPKGLTVSHGIGPVKRTVTLASP